MRTLEYEVLASVSENIFGTKLGVVSTGRAAAAGPYFSVVLFSYLPASCSAFTELHFFFESLHLLFLVSKYSLVLHHSCFHEVSDKSLGRSSEVPNTSGITNWRRAKKLDNGLHVVPRIQMKTDTRKVVWPISSRPLKFSFSVLMLN